LVLRLAKPFRRVVGSLGLVKLAPGVYVYVGSARGPGGLYARIKRHASKEKRLRWHIDYITTFEGARIISAVFAGTEDDVETVLSEELARLGMVPTVEGFGCSDKPSKTHLLLCPYDESACVDLCVKAFRNLGLEPRAVSLTA